MATRQQVKGPEVALMYSLLASGITLSATRNPCRTGELQKEAEDCFEAAMGLYPVLMQSPPTLPKLNAVFSIVSFITICSLVFRNKDDGTNDIW